MYGGTPTEVMRRKNTYEGLTRRAAYVRGLTKDSPEYKTAEGVLSAMEAGLIPDPTGGATHFFDPAGQKYLRRRDPSWASGAPTAVIGGHRFYAPEGRVAPVVAQGGDEVPTALSDDELISKFGGRRGALGAPDLPGSSSEVPGDEEIISKFGKKQRTLADAPAPASTPATTPAAPPGSLPAPPGPGEDRRTWTTPEEVAAGMAAAGEIPTRAGRVVSGVLRTPEAAWEAIKKNLEASGHRLGQIFEDVQAGKPASAAGDVIMGTLGALGAIPAGLGEAVVGRPAAEITGNPEFAEKASMLAPLLVPGSQAAMFNRLARLKPTVRGLDYIVESIPPDKLPGVIKDLERNPRLTLADVVPEIQSRMQGLASAPEDPHGFLKRFVEQRQSEASTAVRGAVNDMGVSDSAYNVLNRIIERARVTGEKVINPIVEGAKTPADVTKVVDLIDSKIAADPVGRATLKAVKEGRELVGYQLSPEQRELLVARDLVRGKLSDRDQMFMDVGGQQGAHAVQVQLRAKAADMLASSDGMTRQIGRSLMDVRSKLVDAVDEVAPGYRDGLAQYRTDKEIREAFNKGMDYHLSRKGEVGVLEDSPEAWRDWVKNHSTLDEVDALQQGILADMERQVGSMRDAWRSNGAPPIPKMSPDDVARVEAVFGKKNTERLVQKLTDEHQISVTNNMLFGGTQTAARVKGDRGLAPREVGAVDRSPPGVGSMMLAGALEMSGALPHGVGVALGVGTQAAGRVARNLVQRVGRAGDIARNEEIARLATATGVPKDEILSILKSRLPRPGKESLLTRLLAFPVAKMIP
jgi:hypothetical protein